MSGVYEFFTDSNLDRLAVMVEDIGVEEVSVDIDNNTLSIQWIFNKQEALKWMIKKVIECPPAQ